MSLRRKDDYINYDNGSAHPFQGGGLYLGKVVSVDSGNRANVNIPSLGLKMRSLPVVNTTQTNKIVKGDSVVCAFLENDNQEVVIIGRINIGTDVYATKTEHAVTQAALVALDARVTALENP